MKTIRQIADEIGVSKQTVYKRFKGKLHTVCAPYAHTINGVLYVEEKGEKLIKQDFLEDGSSKLEQLERSNLVHTEHLERSNGAVPEQGHQADLMAVLQATIDTLQGQLEVKDKQLEQQAQTITQLTEALIAAQQTAAAAQALHAGTMHQQLLSGEVGVDQHGQEPEPIRKRSWISRILGN